MNDVIDSLHGLRIALLGDELFATGCGFDGDNIVIHVWDVARSLQQHQPVEQPVAPYVRRIQIVDGVVPPNIVVGIEDFQVVLQNYA